MGDYKPATCAYCDADTWCETRSDGTPQCRACKCERFFERVLYPPLGLRLIAWQRKVIRELYGTVQADNGLRQYRRALIEVPKKNGKSFLVGGLPIYHLLMESTEIRPEAYGAASAKEQASIVFRAAMALINANPDLKSRLRVVESTKIIARRDGGGFYRVLAADGKVNDGVEPSMAILDELHHWSSKKAQALYTALFKGRIARREPLFVQITTAGAENESPIWMEQHDHAVQVLKGELEDRRFYAALWGADEKRIDTDPEYWKSREARVQANPSHEDHPGGFLPDEAIVEDLQEALNNPVKRSEYLRFNLNIKAASTQENAIDMTAWRKCGDTPEAKAAGLEVDLRHWPGLDTEELHLLVSRWDLKERPCYAGVDASWTTDITGLTLVFPPLEDDGPWTVLPFGFIPEEKIPHLTRRTKRNEIPGWCEKKFLEATPGAAVDIRALMKRLRWAAEMFELREVAYDPWNFRNAAADLVDEGFRCIEIRQNFGQLSEPTKKVLELYTTGKLRHGNHPVLNWHASCLALQGDRKDNVQPAKPERDKSSKRVDLMSALITGMNRALIGAESGVGFLFSEA